MDTQKNSLDEYWWVRKYLQFYVKFYSRTRVKSEALPGVCGNREKWQLLKHPKTYGEIRKWHHSFTLEKFALQYLNLRNKTTFLCFTEVWNVWALPGSCGNREKGQLLKHPKTYGEIRKWHHSFTLKKFALQYLNFRNKTTFLCFTEVWNVWALPGSCGNREKGQLLKHPKTYGEIRKWHHSFTLKKFALQYLNFRNKTTFLCFTEVWNVGALPGSCGNREKGQLLKHPKTYGEIRKWHHSFTLKKFA